LLAAALVCLCGVAASAEAVPRDPRLQQVRSWAFGIGSGNLRGDVGARFAPYDLVVVDGEEAKAAQVAALHARGKLVLAYVSVGTIEPGRPWYRAARRYRLDRYEEYDEYYAKVSSPGFRRLITQRVAPPMLDKGFDGLFLDNTAMIEDHKSQRAGMHRLVRELAALAHGRGKLLFTQNGEDVIGPSLRHYDGWNREDLSQTYSFEHGRYERVPREDTRGAQRALRRIAGAGLLVTASDYTKRGDARGRDRAVRNACAAGALPFVTNIGLTRISRVAFTCPA
jgi:hypothetical protein